MRILFCLSGLEGRSFVQRALARVLQSEIEISLLYVIDTRAAEELGYARRPLLRRVAPMHDRDLAAAEDEIAAEVHEEARLACIDMGVPVSALSALTRRGHPQHEIARAGTEERMDLIVIGARHHGGPHVGPRSVGHVARFVLDHAPCDVLLLRGSMP